MKEINKRIKQLRSKHGLTMARLAEILQVSAGNISDWESEKKKSTPTARALVAISEYFNVSLDWLMTGKERNRPSGDVPAEVEPHPLAAKLHSLSPQDLQLIELLAERLAAALPGSRQDSPAGRSSRSKKRLRDSTDHTIRETGLATEYYTRLPVVGRVTAGQPITAVENIEEYFSLPQNHLSSGTHFILRVSGESMVNVGIDDGDLVVVRQQSSADNGDIVVAMTLDDEATVKTFYKEEDRIRLQPENDWMQPIILNDVKILGKVASVIKDSRIQE
ncbi:transcriptional repressor LexA [Paenibacillus chitinolyticus]